MIGKKNFEKGFIMEVKRKISPAYTLLTTFFFLISLDQCPLFSKGNHILHTSTSLVIGETGSIIVTDELTPVPLVNAYSDPVIIIGGISRLGSHLTTMRVQNVLPTQFSLRLMDWECHNPAHGPERVSYMVVEAGSYILPGGKKLIAQNYTDVDHNWTTRLFPGAFDERPIIFGQCITELESAPVVVDFDKTYLEKDRFRVRLKEGSTSDFTHVFEEISIVAIERGNYGEDSLSFLSGEDNLVVGNSRIQINLPEIEEDMGVFLGGIQGSTSETPAVINYRFIDSNRISLALDFERCAGSVDSLMEEINYLYFSKPGNVCVTSENNTPIPPNSIEAVIKADFLRGESPLEVNFDGSFSATFSNVLTNYFWDFGDGNTGTNPQVTHTYQEVGTYRSTLVVTDREGRTDSASVLIEVTSTSPPNQNPVAVFTANPLFGDPPLLVVFDASASLDLDGNIVAYKWNMGDGTNKEGVILTHLYETKGRFPIELVTIDNQGGTDTSRIVIQVGRDLSPPIASFTPNAVRGKIPFAIFLDGTLSNDSDGKIVEYSWRINEITVGSEETLAFEFSLEGIYKIQLIVKDNDGLADTAGISVEAFQGNLRPIASFSYFNEPGTLTYQFDASTSLDPDGKLQKYDWFIETGISQSIPIFSYTFLDTGTYTIKLIVTDDSLAQDTMVRQIQVIGQTKEINNSPLKTCGDTSFIIGEVGFTSATDQWANVKLKNAYRNPVIITGGLNRKGGHRTTIRVQNVNPSGFDVRLIDWECLNPNHNPERVNYMVLESGSYILPNGKKIIAGNYGLVSEVWENRLFSSSFSDLPIMFAQCISENESSPVVVQLDKDSLTNKQFRLRIRESLVSDSVHTQERVSVVGIEKGMYSDSVFSFETGTKDLLLDPTPQAFAVKGSYSEQPILIGGIQSARENLAATLNFRDLRDDSIKLFLDYEACSTVLNYEQIELGNYLLFGEVGNIFACSVSNNEENEDLKDPEGDATVLEPELKFAISPVPTKSSLTLEIFEVDSEQYSYEIINYAGQRVNIGTANQGVNQLSLDELSTGMYVIRVYSNVKTSSKEFIVY